MNKFLANHKDKLIKYRDTVIKVLIVLYYILVGIFFVYMIFVVPFANPDMTDRRLFVTFWREYLGMVVMAFGAIFLAYLWEDLDLS